MRANVRKPHDINPRTMPGGIVWGLIQLIT